MKVLRESVGQILGWPEVPRLSQLPERQQWPEDWKRAEKDLTLRDRVIVELIRR